MLPLDCSLRSKLQAALLLAAATAAAAGISTGGGAAAGGGVVLPAASTATGTTTCCCCCWGSGTAWEAGGGDVTPRDAPARTQGRKQRWSHLNETHKDNRCVAVALTWWPHRDCT
jgi:hypothetical protein